SLAQRRSGEQGLVARWHGCARDSRKNSQRLLGPAPHERSLGLVSAHRGSSAADHAVRSELWHSRIWPSTSVRCAATIVPESEVDRTCRGHRENAAHRKRKRWSGCNQPFDRQSITEQAMVVTGSCHQHQSDRWSALSRQRLVHATDKMCRRITRWLHCNNLAPVSWRY